LAAVQRHSVTAMVVCLPRSQPGFDATLPVAATGRAAGCLSAPGDRRAYDRSGFRLYPVMMGNWPFFKDLS